MELFADRFAIDEDGGAVDRGPDVSRQGIADRMCMATATNPRGFKRS